MSDDKLIDEYVNKIREQAQVGLNLGCGNMFIEGLTNCDLYNPEAEKILDALDLSEYKDESVDLIEAHHLLEHFSFEERDGALNEWHRVLKPKGYLIISCPDMSRLLRLTLAVEKINWHALELYIYGGQENPGGYHKSCYSPEYLTQLLEKAGFMLDMILPNYPYRPTPTFGIVARKEKK
ncbi:MAG: methyltransferase domain-containing protein [Candidatus Hodarchaeota archaeon]